MSWIGEMADRASGALRDARDAVRGTEYEPRAPGSGPQPGGTEAEAAQAAGNAGAPGTDREYPPDRPATALEAWEALRGGGSRAAILSYLAPGPVPRYDTPAARAQAEACQRAGDGQMSPVYGPREADWDDVQAAHDASRDAATTFGLGSPESVRAADLSVATLNNQIRHEARQAAGSGTEVEAGQ